MTSTIRDPGASTRQRERAPGDDFAARIRAALAAIRQQESARLVQVAQPQPDEAEVWR